MAEQIADPADPADTPDAREARRAAEENLAHVQAGWTEVRQTAAALKMRRERNHFAEMFAAALRGKHT